MNIVVYPSPFKIVSFILKEKISPNRLFDWENIILLCLQSTGNLCIKYNNKLKNPHIADTGKLVFIVDHNVPSDCPKTAASQKKMRDFAIENDIKLYEGQGV